MEEVKIIGMIGAVYSQLLCYVHPGVDKKQYDPCCYKYHIYLFQSIHTIYLFSIFYYIFYYVLFFLLIQLSNESLYF